ncbi:unnamed protein product [Ambrosiozyma monospora]|uniref:Unnamed protein product n=1 Tax=Ambrosiozyma monospora TaxID=43982 RepID=A0A9W7DG61_AMBMO|nr:unnamed protein product [Ambrosiozyma monospora]
MARSKGHKGGKGGIAGKGRGKLAQAFNRHKLQDQHLKKVAAKEQKQQAQKQQQIKNKNKSKHSNEKEDDDNNNNNTNDVSLSDKQHVMATQRPFIPFGQHEHVLLVGEGDFSFALSTINSGYILPEFLIATSFDSLDELIAKYANVEENLEQLKAKGVKIFHDIDATELIQSFKLTKTFKKNKCKNKTVLGTDTIDLILFNFPHSGRGIKDQERNIKIHQLLLTNFFNSAFELFKLLKSNRNYLVNRSVSDSTASATGYFDSSNNINVTKSKANNIENGTDKIAVTLFKGEPYDSWQVKKLARDSINYKVKQSGDFRWDAFPGYHHRRTNSMKTTTKEASERDAKCFLFEKFDPEKHHGKKKKGLTNVDDDEDD